jgi:hypothetical protein
MGEVGLSFVIPGRCKATNPEFSDTVCIWIPDSCFAASGMTKKCGGRFPNDWSGK